MKLFNNNKAKKMIRVIALILAALMVLGMAVIALEALAEDEISTTETVEQTVSGEEISADESDVTETPETTQPEEEETEKTVIPELPSGYSYLTDPSLTPRNLNGLVPHLDTVTHSVRVGIYYIYGSNNCLAFSHNISSDKGLVFYTTMNDEYIFYKTSEKGVTVMRDFSAAKNSADRYYHTTSGNTHIIYHCITKESVALDKVDETIEVFRSKLPENTVIFPLYVDGKAYIGVGTYKDKAASEADCPNMQSLLGVEFVPRTPNNSSVSVVETVSGKILFKIDTTSHPLYVRPIQDGKEERYIKSAVGNIFDGTFEYKTTIDGLYLVNILDIEDYIKSVLPYEISASWPEETLKAFSIVVRSYTLAMQYKNHRKQDFDMCDETHCQAYRGRLRSTDKTDAAVVATNNIVLAYDSKICEAFYHAISGGVTESAELVWGGKGYDYLVSQAIPDEKYENYTNGIWKFEVSEKELFDYLASNSTVSKYVKHPITSVRISKYTDAGYAYELEIVDESGTVSTFTKCDNVRTILSKYCKSARLTIGKSTGVKVNDGESVVIDPLNVIATDKDGNPVRYTAPVGDGGKGKTVISGKGEISELKSDNNNYVISGTGWGHGVGLSQYGARDMANNGYKWQEIALYFFPKSYLAHLSDLSTPIEDINAPVVPEPEPEPTPEPEPEPEPEQDPEEEDEEKPVLPEKEPFKPIKIV